MVKQLFLWSISFSILLGLNACEFDEPDMGDIKNFKLVELDGNNLDVQFDVDIDNPNAFNFKIKDGDVLIKINEEEMGTVKLSEKIKVKRKSENTYTIPLRIVLNNGTLFKLIKIAQQKTISLVAEGTVKGSVCGISKKVPIKETRELSGSDLKNIFQ
jgi:LEA14-like dessication related protein